MVSECLIFHCVFELFLPNTIRLREIILVFFSQRVINEVQPHKQYKTDQNYYM